MSQALVEKVRAVAQPPVEAAGYELVDIEWKHEQGGWVLRAYIDGPGGISHDDCERISRELSAVFDVNDVIPHAYHLEVSSPGLNRPLRLPAHFQRHVGEKAKIRLRQGIDGRRNFAGLIKSAGADTVTVEVDGREFVLPLTDLEKANLEYQFEKAGR
jgi:ribosome maturation factor RimP